MVILAGDVGGTNTRLALFSEGRRDFLIEQKFPSKNFQSLEEIVLQFLEGRQEKIEKACFGVAGPVQNERCKTTNLPWIIEASNLAKVIGIERVYLLNDLEAHGYGISLLHESEWVEISPGEKKVGNAALISAGTGLGEACLYWNGKEHIPFASEGGHVSFSPENEREIELLRFVKKEHSHVSYERFLSGSGIALLYRFLVENGHEKAREEVDRAENPASQITFLAMEQKCPTCTRVLEWFVEIYGSEAGNLALKVLAVGGLYIGGGIAPRMVPFFRSGKFMERMTTKGRVSPLLSKIPVKLILNGNTALIGAARYCKP